MITQGASGQSLNKQLNVLLHATRKRSNRRLANSLLSESTSTTSFLYDSNSSGDESNTSTSPSFTPRRRSSRIRGGGADNGDDPAKATTNGMHASNLNYVDNANNTQGSQQFSSVHDYDHSYDPTATTMTMQIHHQQHHHHPQQIARGTTPPAAIFSTTRRRRRTMDTVAVQHQHHADVSSSDVVAIQQQQQQQPANTIHMRRSNNNNNNNNRSYIPRMPITAGEAARSQRMALSQRTMPATSMELAAAAVAAEFGDLSDYSDEDDADAADNRNNNDGPNDDSMDAKLPAAASAHLPQRRRMPFVVPQTAASQQQQRKSESCCASLSLNVPAAVRSGDIRNSSSTAVAAAAVARNASAMAMGIDHDHPTHEPAVAVAVPADRRRMRRRMAITSANLDVEAASEIVKQVEDDYDYDTDRKRAAEVALHPAEYSSPSAVSYARRGSFADDGEMILQQQQQQQPPAPRPSSGGRRRFARRAASLPDRHAVAYFQQQQQRASAYSRADNNLQHDHASPLETNMDYCRDRFNSASCRHSAPELDQFSFPEEPIFERRMGWPEMAFQNPDTMIEEEFDEPHISAEQMRGLSDFPSVDLQFHSGIERRRSSQRPSRSMDGRPFRKMERRGASLPNAHSIAGFLNPNSASARLNRQRLELDEDGIGFQQLQHQKRGGRYARQSPLPAFAEGEPMQRDIPYVMNSDFMMSETAHVDTDPSPPKFRRMERRGASLPNRYAVANFTAPTSVAGQYYQADIDRDNDRDRDRYSSAQEPIFTRRRRRSATDVSVGDGGQRAFEFGMHQRQQYAATDDIEMHDPPTRPPIMDGGTYGLPSMPSNHGRMAQLNQGLRQEAYPIEIAVPPPQPVFEVYEQAIPQHQPLQPQFQPQAQSLPQPQPQPQYQNDLGNEEDDEEELEIESYPALEPETDGERNATIALHKAVRENSSEVTSILRTYPRTSRMALYSPSHPDYNGEVPLHEAAKLGHKEAIESLLSFDKGCALFKNYVGNIALHTAVEHGQKESVNIITQHMPSCCKVSCDEGFLPLHNAVSSAAQLENAPQITLDLLEAFPRATKITTDEGLLPLHLAASSGFAAGIHALLLYYFEAINEREVTEDMSALDFAVDGYIMCKRREAQQTGIISSSLQDLHPQLELSVIHIPEDDNSGIGALERTRQFKSCIAIILMSKLYNRSLRPNGGQEGDFPGVEYLPLHAIVSSQPLERTWRNLLSIYRRGHRMDRDRNGRSALHHLCASIDLNVESNMDVTAMMDGLLELDVTAAHHVDRDGFQPLHLALLARANVTSISKLLSANLDALSHTVGNESQVAWCRGMIAFQISAASDCSVDVINLLVKGLPAGIESGRSVS